MRAFLSEVMLATDQDEKDDDNLPKVTLMTVHAAKGLEFKHVYVVGVEEDLFPSSMSQDSLAQVEEERRLLYVAITRAKSTCTLTYAGSRFRNGQTVLTSPSRFLGDIDTRFLHLQLSSNISEETGSFVNPLKSYKNYNSVASAKPLYSNAGASAARSSGMKKLSSISSAPGIKPQHTASELSPGSIIVHDKLGRGTVVKIDSLSGEDTITVDFGVIGIKKLLLKFAKFSIVKK